MNMWQGLVKITVVTIVFSFMGRGVWGGGGCREAERRRSKVNLVVEVVWEDYRDKATLSIFWLCSPLEIFLSWGVSGCLVDSDCRSSYLCSGGECRTTTTSTTTTTTTRQPSPQPACFMDSDCHYFEKCFYGRCVQLTTTTPTTRHPPPTTNPDYWSTLPLVTGGW